MVLGLIDFLLGGKKNTKVPKNAQVNSPMNNTGVQQMAQGGQMPNGTANAPTQNMQQSSQQPTGDNGGLQFQDSNQPQQQGAPAQAAAPQYSAPGGRKSVAEVVGKIHAEMKSMNESINSLTTEMKEVQNTLSGIDHRVSELENANKIKDEKLSDIDENMNKFLSLYEVVNNQYNPFVSIEDAPKPAKEIVVDSSGASNELGLENANDGQGSLKEKLLSMESPEMQKSSMNSSDALLELETLDLDEAAADAVPLTNLKSNTNSLVVILSWLEYLVKRAGIEETKNTLRYYTETLKWITPEVYFELDKFLRGMDDIEDDKKASKLNVKDHIVSLYFISKLNEKKLDEKLTKAVLQIIKEK